MIDLDHLESLAKAALSRGQEDCESLNDWLTAEEFMSSMLLHPIDARFAEAARPVAALALIAEVRALREDAERYQALCAAAYQLAGTMNAPVRFLDALSDGSCGELEMRAKTDDLLPVSPDEVGSFLSDEGQEYREDAERYRFARENVQEGYALPGGFYLSEKGGDSWDKTIDAARREKA